MVKKKTKWGEAARFINAFYKDIFAIILKFINDQCFVRAAGLAFSFILAFIPLLALVISLFTAFGGFEPVIKSLQGFLVDTLLPAKQQEIVSFIDQFTSNTRSLGIFGFITFLFSSIFFLVNIENNFNAIWGTRAVKKYITRFTSYTSVLVFGTLLLGASFSFSDLMDNVLALLNNARGPLLNQFLQNFFPFLFMIMTLLLLIIIVPAVRVRFKNGFIGALTGALLWEVAKRLFSSWVNSSIQYSIIYGSLALIPIFLMWVYIGWLIVLLSLEITNFLQFKEKPWTQHHWEEQPPGMKLLTGFRIYLHIAALFREGGNLPDLEDLSKAFSLTYYDARGIRDTLEKGGLILPADTAPGKIIPSRDLTSITLRDVAECLYGPLPEKMEKSWAPVLETMKEFKTRAFEGFNDRTVLDFLTTHELAIPGKTSKPAAKARQNPKLPPVNQQS